LFIRSITASTDAIFIPAAFLYPPSVGSFIGYHVRTEMPLPLQTYDLADACINRWVFLVPQEPTEENLSRAVRRLGTATTDRWKAAGATVERSMATFAEWVASFEDEEIPTALAVLSHYRDDSLRFYPDEALYAENFNRPLKGSIAILSACGSAPPVSGGIVRRLNENGVATVIGTTSKIQPQFGASMLRELAAAGESPARSESTTLARVLRQAQARLFKGAQDAGHAPSDVLKFVLLGHAGMRLCTPAQVP
jgi:hypothetical protein